MHARTRRLPLTRAVVCCAGHLPLRLRARRPRPVCPPEREQGEEGVRVNSTAAELGPLHRTIRRSFRSPPPRHERFLSFSFLSPSPSPQVGSRPAFSRRTKLLAYQGPAHHPLVPTRRTGTGPAAPLTFLPKKIIIISKRSCLCGVVLSSYIAFLVLQLMWHRNNCLIAIILTQMNHKSITPSVIICKAYAYADFTFRTICKSRVGVPIGMFRGVQTVTNQKLRQLLNRLN